MAAETTQQIATVENLNNLYGLIGVLWSVTVILIGVVYNNTVNKVKIIDEVKLRALDEHRIRHELEIQRLKDVQGEKIDALIKRFDSLEISVTALSDNLHKEKNHEQALMSTLNGLLKFLQQQNP